MKKISRVNEGLRKEEAAAREQFTHHGMLMCIVSKETIKEKNNT